MADTIDFKTLWIGDPLRIISTGQVGTFEGIDAQGVKIRVAGTILHIRSSDLTSHTPTQQSDDQEEWSDEKSAQVEDLPQRTIDLHLEKWPNYQSNHWSTPLDFQVKQCKDFLTRAIAQKLPGVAIIHGKGAGTLKQQVRHLLASHTEVFQIHETNQGGAFEVVFNYRKT